jgi:inner membrane protein
MDSLTQIALGAAVGEAVVGRKAGGRGAAWGAVLGTLPDLDILAYPFLDPVAELAFHRGITHSILFAVVMTPVLGLGLARLHRARGLPPSAWMWMVFLTIGTHILLDCFTVYGTQLFQPFSDYPVSWNSLFIIDPLYTVPLGLGVLVALFLRRDSAARQRVNRAGLLISTLYIAWSLVAKGMAFQALERGFADAGLQPERVMSNPTPLNTVLWMGIAEQEDTLYVGLYSLLDAGPPVDLIAVPKKTELVRPYQEERAVKRLLRFSKGWFAARREGDALIFDDLRFGRSDAWLGAGEPVFGFELERGECDDTWCSFHQLPPAFRSLTPVWDRLKGLD